MKSSNVLIILLLLARNRCSILCHDFDSACGDPGGPRNTPGSTRRRAGILLDRLPPSYGDVYFDGAYWGETPVMVTVSTTGNPDHTIRISLPGYEEWSDSYYGNPQPGQTITINAQLSPSAQTGNVQVVSSPSGAMVTLDRSKRQTTPYTFYNIPVGTHEISVYMSGYQDFYSE